MRGTVVVGVKQAGGGSSTTALVSPKAESAVCVCVFAYDREELHMHGFAHR